MIDGVISIPLIADLCLDDFEPPCAPAAKPSLAFTTARNPNTPGRENSPGRKAGVDRNGSHRSPTALATLDNPAPPTTFLAGPENHLLAEVVQSLLGTTSPYNPLVLCGPPGTGKSHLARGFAGHWQSQDRAVLYTNGADFARGFATALENENIASWRALHRGTSLLILEDLTQLSGKGPALAELLQTVDTVLLQEGQVVVTSCLPPQHVAGMPAALASRLVGGLVIQLSLPAAAARLALVERFAELRGIPLPHAAARLLADSLSVTAPELFGAVNELAIQSEVDGEPITPERVRSLLAERRGAVRPTVRSIALLSAKYFGLKLSDLTSPTRRRAVVQARNVAVYLARQLAGKSLEQLGDFFGGRDHTTILHGYRTIETRSRTDPTVRQALSDLRKMLAHG